MIRSFRDRDTERVFNDQLTRVFPPDILRRARGKLLQINRATRLDDLRQPPGNQLEPLLGDRAGQWSIRINRQWRVCFRWDDDGPYDVEITDYH